MQYYVTLLDVDECAREAVRAVPKAKHRGLHAAGQVAVLARLGQILSGGGVFMPLQETFFATRFAQLRDRFGVNWMILHPRRVTPGA